MHDLFVDCTAEDEMLEVQVLGDVSRIFLTRDEFLPEWHVYRGVLLKSSTVGFVAYFDSHRSITSIGALFDRHDTGHRIKLIDIFL